jgi:RNA polymerase sigma factor (sigma-70 family)
MSGQHTEQAEAALTAVFRDEWPKLIGAAARITGDLQTAEDVASETLLTALDKWPLQGIPDRPGAWLMTVCRNRARNVIRDGGRARQHATALAPLLPDPPQPDERPGEIADDRLRLMVMCCHASLSVDAQIALTLRMVGGLNTEEIAHGYHVSASVIAQRIVRAKRTLKAQRLDFASADGDVGPRLAAVLDIIYLIFNEGYLAASGNSLTRNDLAFEAYRLSCLVSDLVPGDPEPWALRALLSFQLSRWATRTGDDGVLLTLEAQDRSKWNRELIDEGVAALNRARVEAERGALLIQAELASCHATAPSFEATRWDAIVVLYDELLKLQDTPVIALNRAVAVAMADGPAAALPILDLLTGEPSLRDSHRVWAVRADLHRRLADRPAALADYDRALRLVGNDTERRYLAAARDGLLANQERGG